MALLKMADDKDDIQDGLAYEDKKEEEDDKRAVGGFDGAGFGNYLLPYAGGAVLAIGLTAAAFYALISGTI
eukprot:CAMPEP_0194582476 /NCGR_PEP_ID=MMETSP0292-20121207/15639_1 /TAXON_ID=39354 /ORGANISM="Heterosigma akashiwo, Strain CCMP2393" /LENGTH=70 /DNA_ID=CAMNT_0039436659 /DNA_START=189 /DNA_END=401 /DNA_ORIENTATION=+